VELRIPIVRSTNTGITALILPSGAVGPRAPSFEPAVLDLEVPIVDLRSPYRYVGDVFLWVVVAAAALAVLRRSGAESDIGLSSSI
jgi:apolipoprotein N-acyltransferase